MRAWIDRKGGRAVHIICTRLPTAAGNNRKSVTSVRIGLVKKACEEKQMVALLLFFLPKQLITQQAAPKNWPANRL